MAAIPALLYFFSIFLMIEADTRRAGARPVPIATPPLWQLTKRHGYHFLAVVGIPLMLILGMSPFRAVFFSMIIAVALSFVDRENALWPRRLMGALYTGARSVLPVASTTATAGIIVGTVTLTGLGLKISGLIVDLAGGYLFLTVLYSAFAIWMLGLAVPVTASYIIAAVMVAPAMTKVGVPDLAAHMFIFYYAVLSEVSPPTALSPFAAAAITGAKPVPTMMLTWKYTLPAFVFPFAFTLSKQGMGLLLQAPIGDIVMSTGTAIIGIMALGAGLGGWIREEANALERTLATAGGLLLFYAGSLSDIAGLVLFADRDRAAHGQDRATEGEAGMKANSIANSHALAVERLALRFSSIRDRLQVAAWRWRRRRPDCRPEPVSHRRRLGAASRPAWSGARSAASSSMHTATCG